MACSVVVGRLFVKEDRKMEVRSTSKVPYPSEESIVLNSGCKNVKYFVGKVTIIWGVQQIIPCDTIVQIFLTSFFQLTNKKSLCVPPTNGRAGGKAGHLDS
jgi:tRNA/tmRNA/rRNA uracil-C5-methylase (TrmA/RlmC/RlmD family)